MATKKVKGGRGKIGEHPKANTNGFDKNPQNINTAGQPKKIYTILKEQGYSATDIRTAFRELCFYTVDELKEVHDNGKMPIITRIIANQLFKALASTDWGKVKDIIEHVIGKPMQPTDITTKGKPFPDKAKILRLLDKNGKHEDIEL
jgi:hypothetical protein